MIKFVFFLLMGNLALAQTVSTFLDDPAVDVDDGLVFDNDGNLYGSNFAGDTVYQISPAGVATPFVSGFTNPNGLAFDTNGDFFVVDWGAGEVVKFDNGGNLLETYNVGPTPSGLIATPTGTVIYTDTNDDSIKEIATDGTITTLFTGTPLNAPVGLAYDENDVLYVGNFVGREVYRFTGSDMEYVATVPDGGAATNNFLGFIAYADGNLYGTNFGGHQIYKINPEAVDDVTLFSGGDQGSADGDISVATFSFPNGIIYNPSQDALYVSEFSGVGNIRRIDGILSIGENEISLDAFIAPNPVGDRLNFSLPNDRSAIHSVSIYTISGALVTVHTDLSTNSIDVAHLVQGMYFAEIASVENKTSVQAFIKN
ncbi:T9SS type A sorting domain-containing protein [Aureisphaera galaxeae]|uniref:T9SS type A sorting domain-containing protein n=1 Tax=Aureisphaera galaxeae TaxID=1538023 RepID=UPI002350B9F9|nr:T9SS type A sorting domain-containing protein [Aureisphaera galaxeae]MDC8004575.1 T9SS type A sorting domain-containing protein [Aureisphaera galaxeae]